MDEPRLRDVRSLPDLLQRPECQQIIAEVAGRHARGTSAEEFIQSLRPTMRMSAAAGKMMAESFGIKSSTTRTLESDGPFAYVCLGILSALAARGFQLRDMTEDAAGPSWKFVAAVPSSPLSWDGQCVLEVVSRDSGHTVTGTIDFPGQRFAWGRGGRLLRDIFEDVESCVERLGARGSPLRE